MQLAEDALAKIALCEIVRSSDEGEQTEEKAAAKKKEKEKAKKEAHQETPLDDQVINESSLPSEAHRGMIKCMWADSMTRPSRNRSTKAESAMALSGDSEEKTAVAGDQDSSPSQPFTNTTVGEANMQLFWPIDDDDTTSGIAAATKQGPLIVTLVATALFTPLALLGALVKVLRFGVLAFFIEIAIVLLLLCC